MRLADYSVRLRPPASIEPLIGPEHTASLTGGFVPMALPLESILKRGSQLAQLAGFQPLRTAKSRIF